MRVWLAFFALAGALVFAAPASAGRLIVTGHDADRRCALMDQQCGFLKAALEYVRETAPAPKKPVLVLDTGSKQLATAIRKAWSGGYSYSGPKVVVVEPQKLTAAQLDVTKFSAVAIASDASCGGCDLEPADVAAITARKRYIQAFLNKGGGIYAGAGGTNAAAYYKFAPIPAPGPPSSGPFQLTPYGKRIGFSDADIACCAAANTFSPPDVGSMDVAARNANRVGDTLIGDGRIHKGKLLADTTIPPAAGQSIVVRPISGKVLGHPPNDPVFRRIVGAANLVSGWTFDVTKGRVSLTTAANSRGTAFQTTQAYEGFFTALQQPGSPVTDLELRSGDFDAACGSGGVDVARAAANTRAVRHLWAKGSGKFRTVGRFASAVIRGTEWETVDRCDGTLIRVKTGKVSVFDQTLQKTVVVTAGHTYLARAS